MRTFKSITALLFVIVLTSQLKAQVSIAPSFVFIDPNNGVGNVFVSNSSDKAYEVTVNFAFGYPSSDADGKLIMNYNDSTAFAQYALDPIIRAFPKTFLIKGGEQRTVRLQILPKERNKTGFYFTRMKVLARPQTTEITDTATQEIGTKINFNFEQITAVFYHKGIVTTGLNVKDIDVKQNEGVLEIRPRLIRTGTAPFLGSMYATLKDAQGKTVVETQATTTAYFNEIRRIDLKLDNVVPGIYTLELSFETRRNDMLASDIIQSPRIVQEKTIVIK